MFVTPYNAAVRENTKQIRLDVVTMKTNRLSQNSRVTKIETMRIDESIGSHYSVVCGRLVQ